jgi:cell wall-associated NlpC family hydrolase
VWKLPSSARAVDRPALSTHPDLIAWRRAQSLQQRRDLGDRVMTQALLGEQVSVLAQAHGWSRIAVLDQRGSYYRAGIIGWVPTAQLRWRPPGRSGYPTPVPHPSGAAVLAVARGYLGVPYVWGGMTPAGIDCSGLVYMVFRRMGITLPRDAADMATVGTPVVRGALRPGDLVFFGPAGRSSIHHVGIYAGGGLVLHAPYTGSLVQYAPLAAWSDYWGARRLLPSG